MARWIGLGAYVIALALFAAFVVVPFVDKKRDIPAEVPSPSPLTATDLVIVKPQGKLCMIDLTLPAQARQMRFQIGTYKRPGPELSYTVKAAGYSSAGTVSAGWLDNAILSVRVGAPPSSRLATVCIRNHGKHKLAFYAASDRAHSRVHAFVDGEAVYATPMLAFFEGRPVSFADRAGVTAGRIAVFRGFLDQAWIVWVLAIGALVVAPLLAAVALSAAQRRSDSSAG